MTREEAINEIKSWAIPSKNGREVLETLIPELRESEDERIRKFLIEILSHGSWRKEWPFSPNEVVAWLEKQKEQKFTHHETNESLEDAVTHQMEDDGDVDDFVRRGIDDIALKYAELGVRWQKEQKPVEWEDYKDKVNVQYCSSEPEWSEEDEKMLARIIERGQSQIQMFETGLLPEHITWLKSLRPSWKPSEEQMGAFKKYIEEFQARSEAAVGGWNNFDVMIRLYEQLKKL